LFSPPEFGPDAMSVYKTAGAATAAALACATNAIDSSASSAVRTIVMSGDLVHGGRADLIGASKQKKPDHAHDAMDCTELGVSATKEGRAERQQQEGPVRTGPMLVRLS
jgi:hypothetical protein